MLYIINNQNKNGPDKPIVQHASLAPACPVVFESANPPLPRSSSSA